MTEHTGLVQALAAAQGEFEAIPKGKHAQAFGGYDYADITAVLKAVRPVLAKHGLAHVQRFDVTEQGGTALVTELMWGAEKVSSWLPLPIEKLEPQKVGIIVTYYRRYALCALLGVAPEDEDDDAHDTKGVQQPAGRPRQAPPRQGAPPPQKRSPFGGAPHEDVGEARYELEGYDLPAASWIETARTASRKHTGQGLLDWWGTYREVRAEIYKRHEAHRDALAQLSADIKERGHANGHVSPDDAVRAG